MGQMRTFARPFAVMTACLLVLGLAGSVSAAKSDEEKAAAKRAKIDATAEKTLKEITAASGMAKACSEKAYGYAVFEARQTALMVASGSGKGVAVAKASGKRTYMKMASLGVNVGVAAKIVRIVFFFENQAAFDRFVDSGWEAGAGASAVAGKEGESTAATFVNGMAFFEITDKGIAAQADISGTKYWKPDNLNDL